MEREGTWLRRDELQGWPVDISGGTKVGKIGDVLVDGQGNMLGFTLGNAYVTGPIAENRSVSINTVLDVDQEVGAMTIDLQRAEDQELTMAKFVGGWGFG